MIKSSTLTIFFTFLLVISSCGESLTDSPEHTSNTNDKETVLLTDSSIEITEEIEVNQIDNEEPTEIAIIRQWFKDINASLSQYKKVENPDIFVYKDMNPDKYAFESEDIYRLGAINLTRFYDGDQLKKAIVYFNGDNQDLTSEYYFKNGELFFVYKKSDFYKMNKSSEGFDHTISETIENRFYFKSDKLISWLDENKKSKNLTLKESIKIEKGVLSDAILYKGYK